MTSTMNALVIDSWGGALKHVERPIPDARPGTVLIDVAAAGIGLTVANAIGGDVGGGDAFPLVPGHELVGTVAEVGDGVKKLAPGTDVGAYFYLNCGRCDACYDSVEPLCERSDGLVGVDTDGGFAEYVRLPAQSVVELPAALSGSDATVVPDAVGTSYHVANQRAAVSPGDDVLILGAGGGVGIHFLQVVQHFGGSVTAVDRERSKLDACDRLGAQWTVDTSAEDLASAANVADGYDAVVDFTGAAELVDDALDLIAPRGRFVNMTAAADWTISVTPKSLVRDEITVLGSRYCSKREYRAAAELVADGAVEPVVSEVVDLEDVPDVLDTVRRGELLGRGAVTL